jgi:hypothetical protein
MMNKTLVFIIGLLLSLELAAQPQDRTGTENGSHIALDGSVIIFANDIANPVVAMGTELRKRDPVSCG